ncbi:Diaminopimelate epimerase [Planctomycetes bacterium Pla163]|uniref:Diaminopimelate epimerase n=1 Tax=Rohdeia mirabilis TaxID=2528008 RepID=A0A518D3Q4_9BACT|nr:Diaminopimelate epimerase [Planctomycetes bacterium Pla163]
METVDAVRGEGCGNAYLFVDAAAAHVADRVRELAPSSTPRWIAGVGGGRLDGVILLERARDVVRQVTVWNADGSRGEVCGNGLRAAAVLVRSVDGVRAGLLASDAAIHRFGFEDDGRVAVSLPPPVFDAERIPLDVGSAARARADEDAPWELLLATAEGRTARGYALSMGNPHLVVPLEHAPVGVLPDAALLEGHAAFPERVNVSYVWRLDAGRIGQRTFERGSGETAACGSGACASAVVARHLGWCDDRLVVEQPGGTLEIRLGGDALELVGPATIGARESLRL